MTNNYNGIATYYDLLSRLIFGNAIKNAQISLLKFIPADADILILGGGTGWILEEIARQHAEGLRISYVEISAKMILLAKKRNYGLNEVEFIHISAEEFIAQKKYDVIITPFFFDNFLQIKVEYLFNKCAEMLVRKGLWLYTDFRYDKNTSPLWQKFLLKIMYLFFCLTAKIETQDLINMDYLFSNNFEKQAEFLLYAHFIKATAYRKSN